MAAVESRMIELGTIAPDFTLTNMTPDIASTKVALSDYISTKGFVVAFICNHCPYVVHIKQAFSDYARDYKDQGIAVIAINANSVAAYSSDSPENMTTDAIQYEYGFPYLYDESQEVARAYDAACTPDIYLFDSARKLVYRGQFDESRPGNDIPVSGTDLRAASDALLAGESIASDQKPSLGCSIKWKTEKN